MSKKTILLFLIGCLLGAIFFVGCCGVSILDVTYDDWLLAHKGDTTNEYVGWLFFRNSDWSFPLGAVENLIYPENISIIYNDSIPLFAFFFKLLDPILPETFQYWGLWTLFVFMMQGGLSVLILNKVTKNPVISCIGSILFIASPLVLQRILGHSALSGHFVLLIAILLYLYKDELNTVRKKVIAWSSLGVLCVLVNVYFFPMIFSIYFFSMLYEIVIKKFKIKQFIVITSAFIFITAFSFWLFGGLSSSAFGLSTYAAVNGYGMWSANINSFLNPKIIDLSTSKFLKDLPYAKPGNYEGYAYLGLGIIISLIVGFAFYMSTVKISKIKLTKESMLDLLKNEKTYIVVCCIFLFSLSLIPDIAFNEKQLFSIPIPKILLGLLNVFRTNGRYLWTVWYVFAILAVLSINKNFKKSVGIVMMSACVVIQLADIMPLMQSREVESDVVYESPLKSIAWQELAENYEGFFFLDEYINSRITMEYEFEIFGNNNGLYVNDTHTSRKDEQFVTNLKNEELKKILHGIPDRNKIYVFNEIPGYIVENDLLNVYLIDDRAIGLVDEIQTLDETATKIEKEDLFVYNLGDTIYFTTENDKISNKYKLKKWLQSEVDGTWTTDQEGMLVINTNVNEDVYVELDIVDVRPQVSAILKINDELSYNIDLSTMGVKRFLVPKEYVNSGDINLTLITHGANSPYDLGESNDTRVLGFKLKSVSIVSASNI